MGDPDSLLAGNQGARHGRVDVAIDHHPVGTQPIEDRLELEHDPGGLNRVGSGADPEIHVGLGKTQIGEEPVAHGRVVVLSGVDQVLPQSLQAVSGM
jgi:hypothetical protein